MPGPRPSRKINFAEKLRAAHVRPLQSGKICRARRDNKQGRDKSLPYEYFVWSFFRSFFAKKEQPPVTYESESSFSTAVNASLGRVTLPSWRIFFLPSFCFSSSFFLRVMSPP